ncbi:hypothetical protein [Jiangella mangrovi]|uniref:Uncharacterized protein n=1 Tax=Jiangella mangrovi TaxID=1524084 RepID=A0A7W9GW58_9ACTN|nr:hypothetical protein [Jiangella mangrovi]MBB5790776.1 hypothetical protein [Jiangella mangrovi]
MDWNAIVLVLVGALLGIGGTAFHDWLQYRRDRADRVAALRRDAVLDFSTAAMRSHLAIQAYGDRVPDGETLALDVGHARSAVRLHCPELNDVTDALFAAAATKNIGDALEDFESAPREAIDGRLPAHRQERA